MKESRGREKKPGVRGPGLKEKHLTKRIQSSPGALPRSTSAKGALTFKRSAPIERNELQERISNLKRELDKVAPGDHPKIAELRAVLVGIEDDLHLARLRWQEDENNRQENKNKRKARMTLMRAHVRGDFDRPEWAQRSYPVDAAAPAESLASIGQELLAETQQMHRELAALRLPLHAQQGPGAEMGKGNAGDGGGSAGDAAVKESSALGEQPQKADSQDKPTSNAGANGNPDVAKRALQLAQPQKSVNRPGDIKLSIAVELIRPKFEQAFEAIRISRKRSPDRRDLESAIRREGITDQTDIDALLSCRKAGTAAAKSVAVKNHISHRTVLNALSRSRKSAI